MATQDQTDLYNDFRAHAGSASELDGSRISAGTETEPPDGDAPEPSDELGEIAQDRPVPCENISGEAGTGKTYLVQRAVEADQSYGLMTATTGIASVNLGGQATTVHAALRYSDTESLRDAWLSGRLVRRLHEIALDKRRLIIDEKSMADAEQLDLIYRGVQEANRYCDVKAPLGITLVGDFGQLAPVKARYAFEASCWPMFAAATTRLTKVWRQDQGAFLDALNLLRYGNGQDAGALLASAGACFETAVDTEFDGTTILPENSMVSRYNDMALDRVPGPRLAVTSRRWGVQRKEHGLNVRTKEWGIPPRLDLKLGAYVMILANERGFAYANGSCGHVKEIGDTAVAVELVAGGGGKVVWVPRLVRSVEARSKPEGWSDQAPRIPKSQDFGEWLPQVHFRGGVRRYVLGQVEYFPLRLAYASTVHKSQGLTLDRVQVDYRARFFGSAGMLYVSLSRCRTLEGLRLVGMREVFARQCQVDRKVLPWL